MKKRLVHYTAILLAIPLIFSCSNNDNDSANLTSRTNKTLPSPPPRTNKKALLCGTLSKDSTANNLFILTLSDETFVRLTGTNVVMQQFSQIVNLPPNITCIFKSDLSPKHKNRPYAYIKDFYYGKGPSPSGFSVGNH